MLGDTWRITPGHQAIFNRPAIVAPHAVANSEEGMFLTTSDKKCEITTFGKMFIYLIHWGGKKKGHSYHKTIFI